METQIPRLLQSRLVELLNQGDKIIVLYGPRQVGKTTLVRRILRDHFPSSLEVNADQLRYNEVFESRDLARMQEVIGSHELLFIDEAQRIRDIGLNLKILHDQLPDLRVLVTGSSSLDLANSVREPLTGRTRTLQLYPISIGELLTNQSVFDIRSELQRYIRFGMYPEVLQITGAEEKAAHLRELTTAYLYKDVLQLSNIRHSDKIHRLLKLLAFQVGSTVSINELANNLRMSSETVSDYIDLLEKGFVVFRLSGFSRNLRKEISKMDKIYFYDTGIRNALIENFHPLQDRMDVGALWENFLLVERMKYQAYSGQSANRYFWRTYTGAELDYVEEAGGALNGFEFKFKAKKRSAPKTWRDTYQHADYQQIHQGNFLEFVT